MFDITGFEYRPIGASIYFSVNSPRSLDRLEPIEALKRNARAIAKDCQTMQPIALYRKTIGAPIQVGVSQGGLYAFMIGTQQISSRGAIFERPIVFVSAKPTPIPNADQWIAISQLIRFSQPNAWSFEETAIAQVINTQLTDILSPSAETGD
jgi:hypothetical protein